MKRKVVLGLAVIAVALPPSLAKAEFRISFADSFGNNAGYGHGGEFKVSLVAGYRFNFTPVSADGSANAFETFCVERNEYIHVDGRHYIAEISGAAINGGYGGGNPDPLSTYTAYLYSRFATRQLSGYNYTPGSGRTASANALQDVIWWFENEIPLAGYAYDPLTEARPWSPGSLRERFFQDALANADGGSYGAQIMNVYGLTHDGRRGPNAQDQLIMLPVPGAAILAGMGLGLVGAARRRRTQQGS